VINSNINFQEPSHHIDLAIMLVDALESLGMNSAELLQKSGIELLDHGRHNDRIGATAMQRFWQSALTKSGRDDIGIICARHVNPISMHGLLIAAASSDTMQEAFERLLKYYRVVTTLGKIKITQNADEIRLCFKLPIPVGVALNESVDAILAGILGFCRMASNNEIDILRVELQRPMPRQLRTFEDFYGCPIKFNADRDAFYFNYKIMQRRLNSANPELARANEQVVVDYLRRFDEIYLANRATSFIIEELPSGIPSQSKIAELMGLSGRTLRRKLSREGLRYAELLEHAQQAMATQYLASTTLSIGAISYMVGYSEPSNFTRSFKKWTNLTPNDFRAQYSRIEITERKQRRILKDQPIEMESYINPSSMDLESLFFSKGESQLGIWSLIVQCSCKKF